MNSFDHLRFLDGFDDSDDVGIFDGFFKVLMK